MTEENTQAARNWLHMVLDEVLDGASKATIHTLVLNALQELGENVPDDRMEENRILGNEASGYDASGKPLAREEREA